jgi:hypothetical protein
MPADQSASGLRAVPDVEAGIQALFELDPADFVAARDDLAKRLRQAGAKEPATAVKGLRRPTVVAWAVNLLARREGGLVEDLLEAGRALDEAQRQAISGKGAAAMRTAGSRRRTALTAAVKAAARLLEGEGGSPDAHLPGIRATLEAASADPDGAGANVLSGRLSAEVAGPSGFGTAGEGEGDDMAMWTLPARPAAPAAPKEKPEEKQERRSRLKIAPEPERRDKGKAKPAPAAKKADPAAEARREELEKARARAEESEAAAAELERAADEAADAADEASDAADAAGKRATELAKELDRAERDARQAERAARVAASDATRAATEARRARTAASRAARVLADLEDA